MTFAKRFSNVPEETLPIRLREKLKLNYSRFETERGEETMRENVCTVDSRFFQTHFMLMFLFLDKCGLKYNSLKSSF